MARSLNPYLILAILAAAGLILSAASTAFKPAERLGVATTTSLYVTGLLEALAEEFETVRPGVSVELLALGSGEALRRAAGGDAGLVLVHAPSLEREYLEKGVLGDGVIFAYNYFVILGPGDDPAGVRGLKPLEAMERIYEAGEAGAVVFISRGDGSGTHVRELALWRLAGLDPYGKPWYLEAGAGMAQTLLMASEKGAYTLSDRGTYLKLRERLKGLEPLVSRDSLLLNIYTAYPVRVAGANQKLAVEFAEFLASESAQSLIAEFGVEEYGAPLFMPASTVRVEELKAAWERLSEL